MLFVTNIATCSWKGNRIVFSVILHYFPLSKKTDNPVSEVTIYGKLESRNPGGSVKDRIALSMVEAGEKTGELNKNKILLKATSGNTGIGLAMVCATKVK